MAVKSHKLKYIDLFAGAGGLSEGFTRMGFEALAHIEMDAYACDTLRTRAAYHYLRENGQLDIYKDYLKNKDKYKCEDLWNQVPKSVIDSVIQATIGPDTMDEIFNRLDVLIGDNSVDLVIGGPPCQAYSVAGYARIGKERMEKDPRTQLYKFYVKFLAKYHPKMFVFENVPNIKKANDGKPYEDLQRLVRDLDYNIKGEIQLASDYGVLQTRKRMIIVGWKNDTECHYPDLKVQEKSFQVLRDLFCDLPKRVNNQGRLTECVPYTKELTKHDYLIMKGIRNPEFNFTTQHLARPTNENDREIYMMAVKKWRSEHKQLDYSKLPPRLQKHKTKDKFTNRFTVVNHDGYAHTVVAHISIDGHYYIYPVENPTIENCRSITVREAARLQSFPDDFYFEGSRSAAFKQIGNAVPVLLAEEIAKDIKLQLENELRKSKETRSIA